MKFQIVLGPDSSPKICHVVILFNHGLGCNRFNNRARQEDVIEFVI
jgi:hypothetical protein